MQLDQVFRDRETEAEPAELARHGSVRLLEWPEQRTQPLGFNANPIVSNVEMKTATIIAGSADGNFSRVWCELHGVVDQIPKHLLKPDAICLDMMLFRTEFG